MASTSEPEVVIELPPLNIKAAGKTQVEQWINGQRVQQSPGYPTLLLVLADAFTNWAEWIVLEYSAEQVTIRYQIDGIWRDMPSLDRPTGDYMLAVLKQICDMYFKERDRLQQGTFSAEMYFKKYKCKVRCQGVPTGERVAIHVDLPRPQPDDLPAMGMREKTFEIVKRFYSQESGLIVSATMPGDGASTLWRGVKAAGDRFVSDYVTLELEGQTEPEVINVGSVTYTPTEGFEAALTKLMLREPDAVFVPNVRDGKMLNLLLANSRKYQRLVAAQIDGRSALDAVFRLLVLGLSPDEVADNLIGTVSQRLVRRLCDACKSAYQPDPATLNRLGIPVGRVRQFFAPFDPYQHAEVNSKGETILPPPCTQCQGVGYFGRLGLFEVVENDQDLKQAIRSGRKLDDIQEMLRRKGQRSFREEGIAAIALGQTSIEEVQRVLKT